MTDPYESVVDYDREEARTTPVDPIDEPVPPDPADYEDLGDAMRTPPKVRRGRHKE